jgi:hypothetical protein
MKDSVLAFCKKPPTIRYKVERDLYKGRQANCHAYRKQPFDFTPHRQDFT